MFLGWRDPVLWELHRGHTGFYAFRRYFTKREKKGKKPLDKFQEAW